MNWKEEAAQRLMDYKPMRTSVTSLRRELKRLEMEATALRSGTVQMGGRGGGSREDRQLNNLIRRQELDAALEHAVLWVKTTEYALSCLDNHEQELLDRIYIRGDWGNVTQLAQDLGMERSTVYRRRDEALRKFTVAMYGKC